MSIKFGKFKKFMANLAKVGKSKNEMINFDLNQIGKSEKVSTHLFFRSIMIIFNFLKKG